MGRWCWLPLVLQQMLLAWATPPELQHGPRSALPSGWVSTSSSFSFTVKLGAMQGATASSPVFPSLPFLLHYYSFTAQPVALWAEGLNSSQQSWGHSTLHGPRAPVPHRQGQREAASNDIDISFLIIDTIKSRADYKLLPRHVTLLLALSLLLGQLRQ